jgi:hypothetical protein
MADVQETYNESILTSVKKLLGPAEEYEHFDPDIIMHINSTLATLTQLGVGPEDGFMITDKSSVWSDFISDDKLLNMVPTYVYLKVKLGFDPPTTAAVLESMQRQAKEYEWRINVAAERIKANS